MTATWTPPAGTRLIDVWDTTYPVERAVTVEAADTGAGATATPEITGYSADPPLPEQAEVVIDGATLTLTVPHWRGAFVAEGVRYRDRHADARDDTAATVDSFDALPPARDAEEVIFFRASPEAEKTWTLTVTANVGEARYTVRVLHDYTPDAERLRSEVDARSPSQG